MIAFGAALAAGATTAAAAGPVPTIASPISAPVVVGTDGNGQSQELTVGQELAVALPDDPSSGFVWELGELDQAVLHQEGEPQFKQGNNPMPGTPGTVVWIFTAAKAGSTKLTLVPVAKQPWAQGQREAYTLMVTVR
ncbi:protease inhibitor I42 family protein [Nocardia sp. CDC159]|uniref:Protease inhibitor I42 family protein n=1 Tax=Nocardia pulmonis TaxID=2951408 RepID=A0A9X2EIA3_9NOCA|nr:MULTISPECIES: protease inhibitor I42 family protein [Nocardia]MCM6778738.1 protease inhibitor I42 family protein [Nocardia pulmonis]MCM6791627.1 protease inhibitor I42 family protein [Nocardia sp. CDC159]